jgi:rubrerythrin
MQELRKKPSDQNLSSNGSSSVNLKGKEYEKDELNPEDLDSRWLRWKCLKCGFVYEGQKPLNVCPRCGNDDPDLFGDAS